MSRRRWCVCGHVETQHVTAYAAHPDETECGIPGCRCMTFTESAESQKGDRRPADAEALARAPKPAALRCPLCGDGMVPRHRGSTGQAFWGCRSYPTCRGTRDTDGESAADRKRAALRRPRLPLQPLAPGEDDDDGGD